MAEYKGTYHNNRGELLKDNVSTGEYFKDKKGIFKDTSGLELAQKRAAELNEAEKNKDKPGLLQRLKDNVMGTAEQNARAKKEMAEQDAKNPDTTQAKVNRMLDKIKPEEKNKGGAIAYKKGGKVRGCGIAQKGLTKGRMV